MNKVVTVAAGMSWAFEAPGDAVSLPAPLTVAVHPNGGAVTVETMTAQGGTWLAVADGKLVGSLSASVADILIGPVYAVRFTSTGGNATVELAW